MWPASWPSAIDLACGFHANSASGTRSSSRRVVAISWSNSGSKASFIAMGNSQQHVARRARGTSQHVLLHDVGFDHERLLSDDRVADHQFHEIRAGRHGRPESSAPTATTAAALAGRPAASAAVG